MGITPSPEAGVEIKSFLDALASDGLLMAWYLNNRQAAITGWFADERATADAARLPALDEAEQIVLSGNVPAVRSGLEQASGSAPSIWVTGWVTGHPT